MWGPIRLNTIVLVFVLFGPTASAQQAQRTYRIGILSELGPAAPAVGASRVALAEDAWRVPFQKRGHVEGQNTVFTLADLPWAPDRALVTVGREACVEAVEALATRGCRHAVAPRGAPEQSWGQ
jgi:hypothetical protein